LIVSVQLGAWQVQGGDGQLLPGPQIPLWQSHGTRQNFPVPHFTVHVPPPHPALTKPPPPQSRSVSFPFFTLSAGKQLGGEQVPPAPHTWLVQSVPAKQP
jgi:hypothetical protein